MLTGGREEWKEADKGEKLWRLPGGENSGRGEMRCSRQVLGGKNLKVGLIKLLTHYNSMELGKIRVWVCVL